LLIASQGIERKNDFVTIATPERALLDMLYLNGAMYFDNIHPLDRNKIEEILPAYKSKLWINE
jgi:hypothetical protein